VTLRYVDEAALSEGMKTLVRHSITRSRLWQCCCRRPIFLSVLSPEAAEPNGLIYLAYVGAVSLAAGLLVLGVGLVRGRRG